MYELTGPDTETVSACVFCGWVDHLANFRDLGRRETADLGVFLDYILVLGEIDAERLVGGELPPDFLDTDLSNRRHS